MLREEVLKKWKACKEKVLDGKKRTLTKEEMTLLISLSDIASSSLWVNAEEDNIESLEAKVLRNKRK